MTYSWIRNFNIAASAIEHVIRVLHDFVLFLQSRHSNEAEAFRSALCSSLDLKPDVSVPKKVEDSSSLLIVRHSRRVQTLPLCHTCFCHSIFTSNWLLFYLTTLLYLLVATCPLFLHSSLNLPTQSFSHKPAN